MTSTTTTTSTPAVAAKFELKFDEQGVPIYNFPPFPDPPPSVAIMPFKKFKPRGIQMKNELDEDAIEVDGEGRPMIQLKVKHDLSKPPMKKKKKSKTATTTNPGEKIIKRFIWYEDWAEGEELRSHFKYDLNLPREDRMIATMEDFKKSRTWPTGIDIRKHYEQIVVFLGLQGGEVRRFIRRLGDDDALMPEEEWEEDDDDVDDPMLPKDPEAAKQRIDEHNEQVRKEMESAVHVESDEHYQKRLAKEAVAKEARLDSFLVDPEFSMKLFFSSYFREKGMIWSEPKIRDYPILLLFFLRFIIRNKALPELDRELQKAVAAVEQAKIELPKAFKFAKLVPDELAACCVLIFGRQTRKEWEPRSDDEDGFGETRHAKKIKLNPVLEEKDNLVENTEAEFKKEVEASGAFFIDHNAVVDMPLTETRDADPEVTAKLEEIVVDKETSAAGVASEWATAQASVGASQSWMDAPIPDAWASDNPWVQPAGNAAEDTKATWKEDVHNLMALLGPTSLPLTHKVGYVEESVRRVVSWSLPEALPVVPDLGIERKGLGTHDPLKKFVCYVLAPYRSYGSSEHTVIHAPELLKDPNSTKKDSDAPANVPTHDPMKDNIIVLLDARTAEHAFEGMAIGGTFVQLVPGDQAAATSAKDVSKKSKKGSGSKNSVEEKPQTWWYAENIIQVLPSYWTEEK
ncbi:hypothetical protein SCHPADRAFT_1002955 [Schizopora paradoxa]|uniref:Uncharacterized protein n=1 Tax=Schizopora paradoxa TaxID=27342 RepID=A0A0H2R0V8_9AGAM|nr:hypothetical protein SCHPADRAFT_1002955 [Schizopora paradoxa]